MIEVQSGEEDVRSRARGVVAAIKGPLVKKWVGRGSWAIADQVVYGLSTFLVNILLGAWVTAEEYGAFAIAFATLVLVLAFYNAIFVEPMLVFGASRYNNRFEQYLKTLLKGHGLFSIACVIILTGVGFTIGYFKSDDLARAMYGLGVAMPFVLLGWLMRRACYVNHKPRLATIGGSIFLVVVLLLLFILRMAGSLTSFTALVSLGIGGLTSGIFLAAQLKVRFPGSTVSRFARVVARRHWVYGRWALAARLPMRLPRIVVLSALPIWAGLGATGTLQALSNPIMPIVQVIAAISLLLIPTLSRIRETPAFFRVSRILLGAGIVIASIYWLLIGLFHDFVIGILYAGNYTEASSLLWYLGIQPVFTAAVSVLGAGFSAVEKPKFVFWAYAVGSIVGLPITLVLMAKYQLVGAIIGSIIMNFVTTIVLAGFFVSLRYQFKKDAPLTSTNAQSV